jgi:hypothetical protein
MKMFMFSLDEDSHEWFQEFHATSIPSLREFHATFNRHCQQFYSSKLIFHNCCEEYKDYVQGITVSNEICEDESCDDEIYEDESHENKGYTS